MSTHRGPRHDGADAAPTAAAAAITAAKGPQNGAVPSEPPQRSAPSAPPVPKMGVRARIAEWPPKRDPPTATPGTDPPPIAALGPKPPQRRSKDVEFPDLWPLSPPRRPPAQLRHRSSSELTLSECDPDEGGEQWGCRAALGGAGGLFREYGSTSSIDAQGVADHSFFAMLRELRSTADSAGGAPAAAAMADGGRPTAHRGDPGGQPKDKAQRKGANGAGESIFKKLRSARGDGDGGGGGGGGEEGGKAWQCQRSFAHYDVQSLLFDLNAVAANRAAVTQRRNTTTGASAASVAVPEEADGKEKAERDGGGEASNELLLCCPHFRNEIGGGGGERDVGFASAALGGRRDGDGEPGGDGRPSNAGVSVLEAPQEAQRNAGRSKHYSVEHVDMGARYYRDYFHGKEHSNYFGVDEKLGPVAVSIRRERLEEPKDTAPQFQFRIIFRTSELLTLRGSILEDAVPSAVRPGSSRGLPPKAAVEHVVPQLNPHCLRLALSAPKVGEQLLKLDEQGLCRRHKVGVLYCRAGQSTEEEMYNNECAGPAFNEFLSLLGERVTLKAFSKYAAQLDTKTDSTGTHSLYTTYQDYEIMFHVSTMLPYTPNNRQQLLRKRHIGNDIVTIVFQEPGALPFTPQGVRSHFQHVFIIVRAHNPCTDAVCYSVAVTRSKDVPPFGPPIPSGVTFRKSDVFRDFLLAKTINAENAAHKSAKFRAMATRTRREYLKDLAENFVTNTPIDSSGKFNLISLTSKKKEKTKARVGAELHSAGAIAWRVSAQDFARGVEIPSILGISNEFVVLLDLGAKEVVFNCFCGDVIGWTADGANLKVFYGRGDHICVRAAEGGAEDVKEIVQRLKVTTSGCDTVDMTLRRNGLGQLGFHVKYDGTVAEVEDYGFAWQAGLRQGSRLVEICKVAVVTLSHEQMIDLLRTSVTVKVVIVPPHDDGAPRRGWAEAELGAADPPRVEAQSGRPPFRSSGWQWSAPNPQGGGGGKWAEPPNPGRAGKQPTAVAYREVQPMHGKRPVSFPESPHPAAPSPYRQPSGSFSAPGAAYGRYRAPPPERYTTPQRPLPPPDPPDVPSSSESSSGGPSSQESTMERQQSEPLWHIPAQSRRGGGKRGGRHDPPPPTNDSPGRHAKLDPPHSTHSSSTTLSSTASSDDPPDPPPDPDPPPPKPTDAPPPKPTPPFSIAGGGHEETDPKSGAPPQSTEPFKQPRQPPRSKPPPGWKRSDDPPGRPPDPKKQVDVGTKNVFGQPRLRASLRDLRSPRRTPKSSIEDDLKRLIIMDGGGETERDGPPPKAPQRTLSDESLCGGGGGGGRRDGGGVSMGGGSMGGGSGVGGGSSSADPPLLLSSTYPCCTLPARRLPPHGLPEKKGPISASELSLAAAPRRMEPGMMPLPDSTGLEWASLVSAAKAYEVQRAVSLFSLTDSTPTPDPPPPRVSEDPPLDLTGKVFQLEAMLKQLHSDLQKEKHDKVVLQAEVADLRQDNRRLQEESQSASEQLRRFARLFATNAPPKKEL